jgi:hypothetical protein
MSAFLIAVPCMKMAMCTTFHLKVVCNEKRGGGKKVANVRNRSQTIVIEVLLCFAHWMECD